MAAGPFGSAREFEDSAVAAAKAALASATEALADEAYELEAASEEQAVEADVALHDLRLERLRLSSLLQRYREQPPTMEELAARYEDEIRELEAEVHRLREESVLLAVAGPDGPGAAQSEVDASPLVGGSSSSGAGLAGHDASRMHRPRARSALEELHDEVAFLRRKACDHKRLVRQMKLEEWRLEQCREQARQAARQAHQQEQLLQEGRERRAAAEEHFRRVQYLLSQGRRELEQEQETVRELNREVSALREACLLPAKVRRESGFLLKLLDRSSTGRSKLRKNFRGVETCAKLYAEVAARAPALLTLAGRVRAEMEADFATYQRLEDAHNRALHGVHVAVTKNVYGTGP